MKRLILVTLLVLTACSRDGVNPWLGYVEGEDALISPPQPGWITHLAVQRGQWVKRGDLLFTLDAVHETAARDQAVANLAAMKAQLEQEQANSQSTRIRSCADRRASQFAHAGTPTNYDQALLGAQQNERRIPQLEAQIKQMEGALADAEYQLSQRRVVAYTEGRVEDIFFREGEWASSSAPVVEILPPANIYVRFFIPETQLQEVKLGQKVTITCDSCKPLTATVTFIAQQEEFTAPDIFSVGNREKLVFKSEARIPGGMKLNPGQPVEVRPLTPKSAQ